ncbi:MAG: hypothetical protein D6762_00605 [Candidatus Neomarinimicrobiota bacterium]|nr:MAG: hypothetical protein D6762_00605 [Candidatus Neomarinimicrobiota bacterium]
MKKLCSLILIFLLTAPVWSQRPYRVGTTAANFLEIGMGSAASAMGDAYVSVAHDLSSMYWNTAGLAYIRRSEAQFVYQPWFIDINTSFTGVATHLTGIGTLGVGMSQISYGNMEVTSLESQEGTGEQFTANEYAVNLSFARKLAPWFAFGSSVKYISSRIWRSQARALALDLGVLVTTRFFAPHGDQSHGLKIGMSISNYGTRMKYDGIDLLVPIDIKQNENGNFSDVPGQFRLQAWELPLMFRIGVSVQPVYSDFQTLTLAVDALHPNNNSESVNVGGEYSIRIPGQAVLSVRAGAKALFMDRSEYGPTFGVGLEWFLFGNRSVRIDYAFKDIGIIGNTHAYTVGLSF